MHHFGFCLNLVVTLISVRVDYALIISVNDLFIFCNFAEILQKCQIHSFWRPALLDFWVLLWWKGHRWQRSKTDCFVAPNVLVSGSGWSRRVRKSQNNIIFFIYVTVSRLVTSSHRAASTQCRRALCRKAVWRTSRRCLWQPVLSYLACMKMLKSPRKCRKLKRWLQSLNTFLGVLIKFTVLVRCSGNATKRSWHGCWRNISSNAAWNCARSFGQTARKLQPESCWGKIPIWL